MGNEPPAVLSFCFPVAEAKIVEASLSLEGFEPFEEEPDPFAPTYPEDPNHEEVRYLEKEITSYEPVDVVKVIPTRHGIRSIVLWSINNAKGNTVTERVDPFTGLTCREGATATSVGAADLRNLTYISPTMQEGEPTIVYGCDNEENEVRPTITLSNPYTLREVAIKVSDLIDKHFDNIYHYNVKGTVVTGSDNDSVVAVEPAGTVWEAKHIVDGTTVTKSAVEVRFLVPTKYTVIEKRGSREDKEVYEAAAGETIRFDPPTNEGEVIQIHACQSMFQCVIPQATVDAKFNGERTTYRPPDKEEEEECEYPYFLSGKGERYDLLEISSSTQKSGEKSYTDTTSFGGVTDTYTGKGEFTSESSTTIYEGCDAPERENKTKDTWSCTNTYNGGDTYKGDQDNPNGFHGSCFRLDNTPGLGGGGLRCGCERSYDLPLTLNGMSPVTGESSADRKCTDTEEIVSSGYDISANGSGSDDDGWGTTLSWESSASATGSRTESQTLKNKHSDPYDDEDGTTETENVDGVTCTGWLGDKTNGVKTSISSVEFTVETTNTAPIPDVNFVTILSYLEVEIDETDDCPKMEVKAVTQVGATRPGDSPEWTDTFTVHNPIQPEKDKSKCIELINAYVARV